MCHKWQHKVQCVTFFIRVRLKELIRIRKSLTRGLASKHTSIVTANNEKPIIFQHNPCHTVCKVLNKILIKLGRTVNPNTQHGNGKFVEELQFKAGAAVMRNRLTVERGHRYLTCTSTGGSMGADKVTMRRKKIWEWHEVTCVEPGFCQKHKIHKDQFSLVEALLLSDGNDSSFYCTESLESIH